MTFDEAVYQFISRVPAGKVTTYGTVARAIGRPRAARQVGNALHRNPRAGKFPATASSTGRGGSLPPLPSAGPKCRQGCSAPRAFLPLSAAGNTLSISTNISGGHNGRHLSAYPILQT